MVANILVAKLTHQIIGEILSRVWYSVLGLRWCQLLCNVPHIPSQSLSHWSTGCVIVAHWKLQGLHHTLDMKKADKRDCTTVLRANMLWRSEKADYKIQFLSVKLLNVPKTWFSHL
jgi:hypothetical protein